ncbi:4Fe-4S cluster-binding domain-containing protein, partial [Prevotella pallens]
MQEVKAPIIGIDRHRLTTDGEGVTTLVAFHGCPLHCKYCLNPQCLSPDGVLRTITP